MDGWVTIGTKLDTTELESQLKEQKKELQKYQKEAEKLTKLKAQSESDIEEYQATLDFLDRMLKKELEIAGSEEQRNQFLEEYDARVTIIQEGLELEKQSLEEINDKIKENVDSQQQLTENIEETNKQIKKMENIENINGSIENITKKIVRWGLAIFGIKSVIGFIKNSMSSITQYDDQLSADIEYMRWALAMTVKPIIEWIIKAVYSLLGIIGGLIKSIFNVNIFANASADAFKKAKDNLSSSNKEAKKLQKTLAGFDEMNILQEDGSIGTGGGGGISTPSVDLSNYSNAFDKFGKQIKGFWDEIFDYWEKGWKKDFNNLNGTWGAFISGLILTVKGLWDIIKGIVEVVKGVFEIVIGIFTQNNNLIKKGINDLIKGIKDILMGVIETVTGILMTIFGLVKGVLTEVWDFITGLFSGLANWFNQNVINPIGGFFSDLWDGVKRGAEAIAKPIQDIFNGIVSTITSIINTIIDALNIVIDGANMINPFGNIPKIPKIGQKKVQKTGGGGFRAKGGIFYPSKLPKLAIGGIINQPGSGVPYNGAYIGERGAEAVVPLTDSQQMALLGESIGKYVNINATIPVYVGNRQIAREIRKIEAENDFAYNR